MDQARLKFAFFLLVVTFIEPGRYLFRSDKLESSDCPWRNDSVRKALSRGADVNGRGMHAMTPLMTASKAGRLDICELLVARGADVKRAQ